MSISFSGTTLTFSDSTTMTTAAVAGPPGPTGPSGSTGPTGPTGAAGTNASVVTTYGAVGSYVVAYMASGGCFHLFSPGCTIAGACLGRVSGCWVGKAGSLNSGVNAAYNSLTAFSPAGQITSLCLSGTWRSVTASKQYNCSSYRQMNLLVRVS